MDKRVIAAEEEKEFFGPLYPFVKDNNLTDVDFNGKEIWVTDCNNGRYACSQQVISDGFVEQFTQRVANLVSKPFHKQNPVLEAETDQLRITIVHESVALTGRCICIRKSPPYVRLSYENILKTGYCSREVLDILLGCVAQKKNLIVIGEPGAGKTELCKFLSGYIPADEKVITIEDTPEWHYGELHPGHDCVELRINEQMDYSRAIKTCLRLNPKWIMLSETRSREVVHLVESLSTGVKGMTTLHTADVRNIPDRMLNMAGTSRDATRFENDIYAFVDVGILVRRGSRKTAPNREEVKRYVVQICFFYRENGCNRLEMIVEDGQILKPEMAAAARTEKRGTYYEAKPFAG
jgi:pilus assembly protein CpaF